MAAFDSSSGQLVAVISPWRVGPPPMQASHHVVRKGFEITADLRSSAKQSGHCSGVQNGCTGQAHQVVKYTPRKLA